MNVKNITSGFSREFGIWIGGNEVSKTGRRAPKMAICVCKVAWLPELLFNCQLPVKLQW
jgi:hypothetical protein